MSILNSPRNNIAAMIHHTRRILRDQNVRGKMDTLDAVAHEVKVGRNTLARIRANPNYSVKQSLERDIARAAFRMFEYPWSLPAERLCQEIRIAILERQGESFENDPVRSKWGFLIGEGTIGRLRAEPERPISEKTEEDWGLLISAYLYQVGICFQEPREKETEQQEDDTFDFISHRLFDWLRPHSDHLWAFFLEFHVLSNLIGLRWNQTPSEERNSEAMWKLILKSGYFELVPRYMAVCPRDSSAVENALAYASRFGATEYFAKFREFLISAHMGREPAYTKDNGFDDDFDNYRSWLASGCRKRSVS